MRVFKLKDVLISLILSFLLLLGVVFPFSNATAQTYDIVIETEINEQTVKIIEINFSEDIVHFYKFDSDGNPIFESNGGQVTQGTFVPGDEDFEEYVENLSIALLTKHLEIESAREFSYLLHFCSYTNWPAILQLSYYDASSNTACVIYEHDEMEYPFNENSVVGDFSFMFVNDDTFDGYKYSVEENEWIKTSIAGETYDNIYASMQAIATACIESRRPSCKVTVTFNKGTENEKTYIIEDKGDGKGPSVYEDKDGDGEADEDEEITDQDKIDEILDKINDDLNKPGGPSGEYEVEAKDCAGNPTDVALFFKRTDGSGNYFCFRLHANGIITSSELTHQQMALMGFIPSDQDPNPEGAWFVCSRVLMPGGYFWQLEKYAKFDANGNPDPNGEQKPYHFAGYGKYTPIPYDPSEEYYRDSEFNDFWPPLP